MCTLILALDGMTRCVSKLEQQVADHMAGFAEQPELKRQKLSLKVKRIVSDHSADDVEESSVSSAFSERTATSAVVDLTEDEDANLTDNR